jgi:nucleoside-diphosphate-sugar epimerase
VSEPKIAVILGGTSLVAPFLSKRLARLGYSGERLSRRPAPKTMEFADGFPWRKLDATKPGDWVAPMDSVVISAIPLWSLREILPKLAHVRQLIVFSSTSVFSKSKSKDRKEIEMVDHLNIAEKDIHRFCQNNNIPFTIVRPTLIYDGVHDRNVTAIKRFIRRWGFFPVATPAKGLRQPVHADDLAAACVAAIDNARAFNKSFNLSGGDTLTYYEMVDQIFHDVGKPSRIVQLPTGLLAFAFRILSIFRPNSRYSPELFRRMNQDLVFSSSEAVAALDYQPRKFEPGE